jgi:hypothetical protein
MKHAYRTAIAIAALISLVAQARADRWYIEPLQSPITIEAPSPLTSPIVVDVRTPQPQVDIAPPPCPPGAVCEYPKP